ncbi:MAG: glycosyltransferase family 4 protein [Bacteroidales bacterium]|nr:glycosyltransferase family 4 protein [Bacteroidales bacterium]
MNVLFLTMSHFSDPNVRGIYTDLMRCFRDKGHTVYVVNPRERGSAEASGLSEIDGVKILGVRTLKLQKTNVIEKGVGQVLVESQFKAAIRKYLSDIRFDLILYTTPPITFPNLIGSLRKANPGARTYLLLKDIFPQNAVDLGMFSEGSFLYKYFRRKEQKLYRHSDVIGCMSPANVDYVLKHNPDIDPSKVEVNPNSIALVPSRVSQNEREAVLSRYSIPLDKPVLIYGGNLGKPQGIGFLMQCLEANADRNDCHFVVVGAGTELPKLKQWHATRKPTAVSVMNALPKRDYDILVRSCDVGLIFLDHRFTIPNFPSRLLSYLEYRMPVLVATDSCSDMGPIAQQGGFGFWCESNSVDAFNAILEKMLRSDRLTMGEKGFRYLEDHYLVENTYNTIMRHV